MSVQSQRSSGVVDERGFNAINRGVYIADNLDFLRSLNDECIDLVCIDPPFAKNDTFKADKLKAALSDEEKSIELALLRHWGIESAGDAQRANIQWVEDERTKGGYKDIWSWEDDIHEDWIAELETHHVGISKAIDACRYTHGEGTAAYLCYMAIRLIEMHRVLKPNGSLWVHCDTTANSYIRQLLDGIFGEDKLRNEVVWHYGKWTNDARQFQQNHDTIYFYTKGDTWTFNPEYFMSDDKKRKLKAGYSVNRPNGVKQLIVYDRAKAASKIAGGDYDKVVYRDQSNPGVVMHDVWHDINILNSQSIERTHYPTQKPHQLAERIIKASSNPGDVVLDCFAGCAYVAIAAEKTDRRWVACDINPRAWTIFKRQLNKPELIQVQCNDYTTGQQVIGSVPTVTVHGPAELPLRTSTVNKTQPPTFTPPERKFKVPASIIPEREMLVELLELSDYSAWCCGFANRMPSGKVIRTTDNFQLDHIDPKSKQGSNDILNRAPMCQSHNNRKGTRRVHLEDYRKEIAEAGELKVDTVGDLVQLPAIRRDVEGIYARAYAKKYPLE